MTVLSERMVLYSHGTERAYGPTSSTTPRPRASSAAPSPPVCSYPMSAMLLYHIRYAPMPYPVCAAAMSGTDAGHAPTPCPVLARGMLLCHGPH
eukprot:2170011-Rhodomonas_salina.1